MHPITIRPLAGDAGPLNAPGNPSMAERFHFWRGESGRRYACTVFADEPIPAYERYVALFIRRQNAKRIVLAVDCSMKRSTAPVGFDEIHVHLAEDDDALASIMRDLSILAEPVAQEIGTFSNLPVFAIGKQLEPRGTIQLCAVALFKRAANHSNVASRIPSVSSSFTVAST